MIQVIGRAFDILEYVANGPDTAKSLSEIAGALDLNAGTCANIIKTIVERKYLEKIDKKKGYILGPRAYELTGNQGYKKALIDIAKGVMQDIVDSLNENCLLAILAGDTRKVIYNINGVHDLQAITSNEKKAFISATGRLLVAFLPEAELNTFIDQHGLPVKGEWVGAETKKGFLKEIEKIRKEGYATQISKNQIIGLSAPVWKNEKVVASLGVYMPEYRYHAADRKAILKLILSKAQYISNHLG